MGTRRRIPVQFFEPIEDDEGERVERSKETNEAQARPEDADKALTLLVQLVVVTSPTRGGV